MIFQKLDNTRFDEFFELVTKMVAEAEFCEAVPELSKIKRMFNMPNIAVFGAFDDNKLIGFISGMHHEYFFSSNKKVSDLGFYILPEYRGSRASIKLLKELENWAQSFGVEDLYLGQTTAVNIEKTQKFYERLGYKTVGFNTVKHLRN